MKIYIHKINIKEIGIIKIDLNQFNIYKLTYIRKNNFLFVNFIYYCKSS